eukprot:5916471-Pleurochrysis_carterae.AAC.2
MAEPAAREEEEAGMGVTGIELLTVVRAAAAVAEEIRLVKMAEVGKTVACALKIASRALPSLFLDLDCSSFLSGRSVRSSCRRACIAKGTKQVCQMHARRELHMNRQTNCQMDERGRKVERAEEAGVEHAEEAGRKRAP